MADLKKENAKLKKQVKDLQSKLAKQEPSAAKGWQARLAELVKRQPEQVEKFIAQSFGLPPTYESTQLVEHAPARANAVGPEQFIEKLENFLIDGASN